jgi:hypothetical protein
MTGDEILGRLGELANLLEGHRAAIFLLELERDDLRTKLRAAGWTPSPLPEKPG